MINLSIAVIWLLYVTNENLWHGTLKLFQILLSKLPFHVLWLQLMIV
jgi:hypothetical protein